MPGLDPGIHEAVRGLQNICMDRRVKPGDDVEKFWPDLDEDLSVAGMLAGKRA